LVDVEVVAVFENLSLAWVYFTEQRAAIFDNEGEEDVTSLEELDH